MTQWESYEDVARYLVNQFATEFGLNRVEGKQEILGLRSGTTWEIDGKGVCQGNGGFLIIECRRYTTSRQDQGKVGSLAYTIIDTGAIGGIMVSPLGLQEGAKKIAAAENIIEVHLDENSNRYEYMLQFLRQICVGVHDRINTSDRAVAAIARTCEKCGIRFAVTRNEHTCSSCSEGT